MTKKDFELIAAVLRAAQTEGGLHDSRVIAKVAARFATALAQENPRFDRARFLRACGLAGVQS